MAMQVWCSSGQWRFCLRVSHIGSCAVHKDKHNLGLPMIVNQVAPAVLAGAAVVVVSVSITHCVQMAVGRLRLPACFFFFYVVPQLLFPQFL